jgi:hypothetical protein
VSPLFRYFSKEKTDTTQSSLLFREKVRRKVPIPAPTYISGLVDV